MKALLLVCLCLFVSEAFGNALPLAMQVVTECKALAGPEISELKDACLDGPSVENPSEELKCFYKCLLEKNDILRNGQFSPNFKMNVDLFLEKPHPKPEVEKLFRTFKMCIAVNGTNPCDLAYNFVKCSQPGMSPSLLL